MKMKHNNKGFSLVELIVVIAIMAILGGVGTVGYSKYIENTNKKADMALVGDIMRAIETGTNSTMFVNDDSFKMGKLAYPVGFVALNENGATVITSYTEEYPATTGKCQWMTLQGLVNVENKTKSYLCEQQRNISYTEVTPMEEVTYCATHSAQPNIQSMSGEYVSGWNHEQGTKQDSCFGSIPSCENGCGKFELIKGTYPDGAKTVTNLNSLYIPSEKDTTMCEAAYANQYGTFGTPDIGPAGNDDKLHQSLTFAFGDNFTNDLKLHYDGWSSEEGTDFATFYLTAPELMEDMESLSGLLADYTGTLWFFRNYPFLCFIYTSDMVYLIP